MTHTLIDRTADAPEPSTGLADAVLVEIATLLDALLETGVPGAIDLRSLPMTETDRAELKAKLGEGEVKAELNVAGPSFIEETGAPGVWWIRHEGADGRVAAETIAITFAPDILFSHPDDVAAGRERLREMLRTAPAETNKEASP